MGCGASKDAACAPAEPGVESKKKKREKDKDVEAHHEEADSGLLLSSPKQHSDELGERLAAEIDLHAEVNLHIEVEVQPVVPLVIGSPVDCSSVEVQEVPVPRSHFALPSPAQVIAESKPTVSGSRTSTPGEQARALSSLIVSGSRTSTPGRQAQELASPLASGRALISPLAASDSRTSTPGQQAEPPLVSGSRTSTPSQTEGLPSSFPVQALSPASSATGSKASSRSPTPGNSAPQSRQSSARSNIPVASNAGPAMQLARSPLTEQKVLSQVPSPAVAAIPTGSAAQSINSSPTNLLSPAPSSRAPSTLGDSKTPTPRQVHQLVDDSRSQLTRNPSPFVASQATRLSSPAQSISARSASPAPLAPGAASSPGALKSYASRTLLAQPSETSSVPASRISSPRPVADLKRTSSAVPSEAAYRLSRTPSPAPPPTAPRSTYTSRTPSPAPPVADSRLELRRPAVVAPSQEELRNHFSCPSLSQPEMLQDNFASSSLPQSTQSSGPQSTDEQRRQLLADLAEKISRSSSGTSVASLKDSRSSSKSPAASQKHSRASSRSPAVSCKAGRGSSGGSSRKAFLDEDLSAAAAAALQAIVNSVTTELAAKDEADDYYPKDEPETREDPKEEDVSGEAAETSKPHQNGNSQEEDIEAEEGFEELTAPDNLESILSCVEIKRSQQTVSSAADNGGNSSPRPGLMDYYLGLRSGEYKLSSPSSSASSQNEGLADIKSALDDLDLTIAKEEFSEGVASNPALDDVYNEIRKLKFSSYAKQENGTNVSTEKLELVTTIATTTSKAQVLDQVASPLSSKASVEEGDVFIHKLQSLLTRMT